MTVVVASIRHGVRYFLVGLQGAVVGAVVGVGGA